MFSAGMGNRHQRISEAQRKAGFLLVALLGVIVPLVM